MRDLQKDAIVYQIFPDRFNIGNGKNVFQKKQDGNYSLPKQRVRRWDEKPFPSTDGSHQYDFWGGDLIGITEKLDYIKELGANAVYLNPIFWAHTNHKYDTIDYFTIDPDLGSEDEFIVLLDEAHRKGIRVILDGVFNHVGTSGKWLNRLGIFDRPGAEQGNEKFKSYFFKGEKGLRGWMDSDNLIELNLENPELAQIIYDGENSAVSYWLKRGIDGWRLDVAYDLGPQILKALVHSAKTTRPDSSLIGEIWNYPGDWPERSGLDGLMNYYFRLVIWEVFNGYLSGRDALQIIEDAIRDAGLEFVSKSWTVLSSHDVPRLRNELGSFERISAALTLQYCLPGIPLIYYGEEIGMEGGNDPENRAPMEWENIHIGRKTLELYRKLNSIRQRKTSLRSGDFKPLTSSDGSLVSFKRINGAIDDLVVCVVNPTGNIVRSRIFLQEGFLMNGTEMKDMVTGKVFKASFGTISVELKPYEGLILEPVISRSNTHYTPYKRI
ncbi:MULTISPECIES: glycoside hydrolase family 13 protein [unclassified Mesotoga]|uniref:glycoside hydrolase family 13 protein n=1 Tax=unclassified Mesotoga TaxID=1184398 RepID=UPI000DA67E7E|nr:MULTISPECIES: glycoside hydrolase family 13 protein [unclassified Mesotoga]PZC52870.1 alpha amylase [Mesotoga sp. TolDC]